MIIVKIFKKIVNYIKKLYLDKPISLNVKKEINIARYSCKGDVLISYITSPFITDDKDPIFNSHSNHWECKQIARTFLELGYNVDIIHINNKDFIPKKKYKIFLDNNGSNFCRLQPFISADCIKILHFTESHWLFHNLAEYTRLEKLKDRRKIVLLPRRITSPNSGFENADFATIIGNDTTLKTYSFLDIPKFLIPISSPTLFDFPENKDFNFCKSNFLWFGGMGLVHKGLDLVLEAFNEMPDHNLTICGPIDGENDFKEAFHNELFKTKNIKTIGWVYADGQQFIDIANNCVALIYPSASEGQAGSIITCLNAGLIPLISVHSGVRVDDFGFILEDCSISEIKTKVKLISSLSADKLKNMSENSWNYARSNHTREIFADNFKRIIEGIIKNKC